MNKYRVHISTPWQNNKSSTIEVESDNINDAKKKALLSMDAESLVRNVLKVEQWVVFDTPAGGYWSIIKQYIEANVSGRLETGPLKVNSDWNGYFIRGDNACAMAFEASNVREWFNSLPEDHRKTIGLSLSTLLSEIEDMSVCRE